MGRRRIDDVLICQRAIVSTPRLDRFPKLVAIGLLMIASQIGERLVIPTFWEIIPPSSAFESAECSCVASGFALLFRAYRACGIAAGSAPVNQRAVSGHRVCVWREQVLRYPRLREDARGPLAARQRSFLRNASEPARVFY